MGRRLLPVLALLALGAKRPAPAAPDVDAVAADLLGAALLSDEPVDELRQLCDEIGARFSGTPALDAAIAWGAERMREDGLVVTLEPVDVPRWVRGPERGEVLAPLVDDLPVLGLGGTVATPPGGLEADVLVVSSFDELDARAAEAAGRVVVWDVPFTDYGSTVPYRYGGASAAARHGAVASLVRSVTPVSLSTPHTGGQRYADDVTPVPAAAITVEDAARLHRWQEAGHTPRVRLVTSGRAEGTAPSANVVGELRGRERPDEIVVLGCHLDSWDVGQGAQDDGAGCVTVMQAGALLAALPVPPRRTVRVVLFTNEENGLAGGRAYARRHDAERIVAAVEDDTGSGAPLGFHVDARSDDDRTDAALTAEAVARLTAYARLLAPLGAAAIDAGHSGADVDPLVGDGALGLGLAHDMTGYWPVHHTEADTFDKVDPALVRRNAAAMAVMAWVLAETDAASPRGGKP